MLIKRRTVAVGVTDAAHHVELHALPGTKRLLVEVAPAGGERHAVEDRRRHHEERHARQRLAQAHERGQRGITGIGQVDDDERRTVSRAGPISRAGSRVTVISTLQASSPMIADELRTRGYEDRISPPILGGDKDQRRNSVYRGGLKIYTTFDPAAQAAALRLA